MEINGRFVLGILLLIVVNIVWVLSAEVTKYLYVDLNFKRPFLTTYLKSCLFTLFLVRYLICGPQAVGPKNATANYNKLDQSEDELFENETLTLAEFEPITFTSDSEAENQATPKKRPILPSSEASTPTRKKVSFSVLREVRRLPEKIAKEARLARLPYRPPDPCSFNLTPALRYMFYFAPLWLASSLTYQVALVYSSVSTVNLISASSSLFVLILSAIFSYHIADRFTWTKCFLVFLNLSGVAIVSQFSAQFFGVVLSFISALVYAIYLVVFSNVSRRTGQIDINLMFGVIGVFSFVAFTPVLLFVHQYGIERQLPPPTTNELLIIVFNSLVGSIFSDYLWLYATLLTSSLVSSISLTLTIPMSLVADFLIRHQTPSFNQLVAAIPIMISFIGASLLNANQQSVTDKQFKVMTKKRLHDVGFLNNSDESENLMNMDDELEI